MKTLYEARLLETPPLPQTLQEPHLIKLVQGKAPPLEIHALFPHLSAYTPPTTLPKTPLKVGVVLSGGQAPGGHNVICGLLAALMKYHPASSLIGFLEGPKGIITNRFAELTPEKVEPYLNTGGFDMIGSGRTKIETEADLAASLKAARELDGLVIIGGDDSNTNAALLAEYFLSKSCPTAVVGVPKTIDGDLKNELIEQPFGFDTAVKVYSEIVGNLLKDALSAKKYWYFIRLMGRSASHITLATALETQPNLTLISEEKRPLEVILNEIVDLIEARYSHEKPYGAILIPEGIIESLPSLPAELTDKVSYDAHGNLEVSKLEVERLLIDLVKKRLSPNTPFSPQPIFLGYEGRSAFPSTFDATYAFALGHVAALLVARKATGHIATLAHLTHSPATWLPQGAPLLSLLTLEPRKGVLKPVTAKSLVELTSPKYLAFKEAAFHFRLHDAYRSPGPIQFWGPPEVVSRVISP